MGTGLWIVIGSLGFTGVVILVLVFSTLRKSGAFGMSKAQQKAAQLTVTGTKARRWIIAIQPTGMVVNNINIQCDVVLARADTRWPAVRRAGADAAVDGDARAIR